MAVIEREFRKRSLWLAERRNFITATDTPALFGASKWKDPFSVFYAKTQPDEDADEREVSEQIEAGNRLERPVLDWFSSACEDVKDVKPNRGGMTITYNDKYPHLCATLDAYVQNGELGIAECKLRSYGRREWEAEGLPDDVYYQVQHQLLVSEKPWCYVVALLDGYALRWEKVEADEEVMENIAKVTSEFYFKMLDGEAPEPGDGEATLETLKRLHPEDNGETILLPKEADGWHRDYVQAQLDRKAADAKIKALENRFRNALEGNTFGQLSGVTYSLKTQERKATKIAATKFRVLRYKQEG